MDVDLSALTNAEKWAAQATEACDARPSRAGFRDACGGSRIGTNVDSAKLEHFRSLDPPRIVSTLAFRTSIEGSNAFAHTYEQGDWGPRRRAFEEGVHALGEAVYGTLDLDGCPGDAKYGAYRLCYPASPTAAPIVLPHNSALFYGAGGVFLATAMAEDVARWDERAYVATVVHGVAAEAVPADEWPLLLAQPDADEDLLEVVVRDGARPLADVHTVRIEEEFFTAVLRGAFDVLASWGVTQVDTAVRLAADLAKEQVSGMLNLIEVPERS